MSADFDQEVTRIRISMDLADGRVETWEATDLLGRPTATLLFQLEHGRQRSGDALIGTTERFDFIRFSFDARTLTAPVNAGKRPTQ